MVWIKLEHTEYFGSRAASRSVYNCANITRSSAITRARLLCCDNGDERTNMILVLAALFQNAIIMNCRKVPEEN